ncbi:MAG: GC-type dockerin domain-anchored protein, partial [Planctomycetota bacterium]
ITIEDGPMPGQVLVRCDLEISNESTQTNTFQFFNLADFDVSQTVLDDIVEVTDTGATLATFQDAAGFAQHLGVDATRWQVGNATTVRNAVSSGAFDLSNDVGPFTGDAASAMQWTVTLAPGETTTISSAISLNVAITADPCPSIADITATGGCTPGTGDGVVDLSDFSCYLTLWSTSSPLADITATGSCVPGSGGDGVDLSDFSCYLSLWSGGCDGDPTTPI